jgi:hypothetical protein
LKLLGFLSYLFHGPVNVEELRQVKNVGVAIERASHQGQRERRFLDRIVVCRNCLADQGC